MKKRYHSPSLIPIGDMVNNTLGASGDISDNSTRQASGNGGSNNAGQNNAGRNNSGFNNDGFNNDGFAQ